MVLLYSSKISFTLLYLKLDTIYRAITFYGLLFPKYSMEFLKNKIKDFIFIFEVD